ncbi:HD domain-containing protein [Haloferax sp. MBLA0076]|uniref:HD domain-containing protein n=1 Tax=Haloferax litoreum TaxID=2666140 RepID=A0A6A8GG03_9EURY|nr:MULTISPECIES: HD domain-containing protein [Haloferax]KAB1193570.1 HD domain-containing protein [Haloferax sp. CBA1148]MRX22085.1 HD domain-containing protein [Haloferax litoreum]
MTAVKDSVHDYISLDPVAAELVDTPEFQRLRHIKQLSTVRLVYPSASHTRFEHSLGVYHLASRALSHLGIDGDRAAHVRAAALLHDIGHGPYGHQTEDLIRRRTGRDHDEIHHLLDGTAVGDVLDAHGLDPGRVATLVAGDSGLGQLVSGELDVDRMDYLVRDAHHTGVPYGTIDHGRLVRELRYRDGKVVLAEGNVQTAESLLLARALMNGTVYRHHVSRIAGAMLERASERLVDDAVSLDEFVRMADHDLLVALGDHVPELGRRIECRNLYKRAVWAPIDAVSTDVVELDYEASRAAEREIADVAGVSPVSVIVDAPSRPRIKESRSRVVVNGVVRRLEDASELVGALRAAERTQWRLGVYAPESVRDEVAAAAIDVLDVPTRVTTHA